MNKDDRKEEVKIKHIRIQINTLIGIILLLAGIFLASFPYIHNMYYQWVQERQIEEKFEEIKAGKNEQNPSFKSQHYGVKREPVKINKDEEENPSFIENSEEEKKYAHELPEAEGILEIPILDLKVPIGYGIELTDLQDNPGFYPESDYPERGNVSIAGHRTTWGAPFRRLGELNQGDKITLYYKESTYSYEVDRVFDTDKYDWSVIENTTEPAITLTTCHPPGSAEKRLIVRGYIVTNE